MSFLESLNWRFATKSFDKAQKLSESDLNKILTSIQMAPTSFGLQPFYVKVVEDESIRKQLQEAGWGQDQFLSSSQVFVFVRLTNVSKRIDEFLDLQSGGKPEVREQLKGFEDMLRGFAQSNTPEKLDVWATKQVYIALGFALAACAELKVDSCPMEGFVPDKFDQILGLPKDEKSTVVLTVGYRNPSVAVRPKVRFPLAKMFVR